MIVNNDGSFSFETKDYIRDNIYLKKIGTDKYILGIDPFSYPKTIDVSNLSENEKLENDDYINKYGI